MAQAVAPLHLELQDGDDTAGWIVEAVDPDGVCELDTLTHPVDVLDALLGEDLAEEILDVLDPKPWPVTVGLVARVRGHFHLPELPPGMWTHLVEQIDLYGDDIEADFFDRGTDLLDWFRGRRPWPQLHRLLRRMPEGCRYRAAVLDDDELARERIAAGLVATSSKRPPLLGETQDRAYLRALVTAVQRVEFATYAAVVGKKAGQPPRPLLGPETAEDRVKDQIADVEVAELFDAIDPSWRDSSPPGFTERPSGLFAPTD